MVSMDNKAKHLDPAYQTALIVCAVLNLAMLFVEGSAGLWIGSAALLADAGDFLEDAAVLGLAFVAIGWSVRARAAAGVLQGFAMAGVGIGAIVQIVRRISGGWRAITSGDRRRSSTCFDREWVLRLSPSSLSWWRCVDACNLAVDAKRRDAERPDRCSRRVHRDYEIWVAGHHRGCNHCNRKSVGRN